MDVRSPSAADSVRPLRAGLPGRTVVRSREELRPLLIFQRMCGDLKTIDAEIVQDVIGVQPLLALDEIAAVRSGGERRRT
jgi:hypothetical protein